MVRTKSLHAVVLLLILLSSLVLMQQNSPDASALNEQNDNAMPQWAHQDLKAFDPWGDSDNDARDIVAVYWKNNTRTLDLRVDLLDLRNDSGTDVYFAIDYKDGGNSNLTKDKGNLTSNVLWDLLAIVHVPTGQSLLDTVYVDNPIYIDHVNVESDLDYVEVSLDKSALIGWDERWLDIQIITVERGSTEAADKSSPLTENSSLGRAKLVIVFGNMFSSYGPGSISWYDGYALDANNRVGERRGVKYFFDAFEKYQIPISSIDVRSELIPGLEYLRINDRIRNMSSRGLIEIIDTLSYGYFMPWQPKDVDRRAIEMAKDYRQQFGLPQSKVFFPYEAMLTREDVDVIKEAGYSAILGGDRNVLWFGEITDWSNATAVKDKIEAGKKIHMVNGMKIFLDTRNGNYQGFAWDPRWGDITFPSEYAMYNGTDQGLHLFWRRILLDMALDSDQEKYFTIGTDLTLTPMAFQDVAERNAKWLAAHPWIEPTTFSKILQEDWKAIDHSDSNLAPDQPLEQHQLDGDVHYNTYFWQFYYGGVSDGHSPLIEKGVQIESYFDYIPYIRDGQKIPSGKKMGDDSTPGTIIYETLHNLRNSPNNPLTELAWRAYFLSIAEQTFHARTNYSSGEPISDDWGGRYLHPAAKVRANLLGQVNKIVAAARWADQAAKGLEPSVTQVLSEDLDLDGVDEYIMKNDKIFATYEDDGGRLEYAYSYDPSTGPIELIAPTFTTVVPGLFDKGYGEGEITVMPTAMLSPAFFDAAFAEGNDDYQYRLFNATLENQKLSFASNDGRITKTFTLTGNTIQAHYVTRDLPDVRVGFGFTIDTANMYSRTGLNKIRTISTPGGEGWEIEDGPYVLVNKLDTEVISVDSFLNSSAPKDMKELQNFSYPSGHWFLFPYNSITIQGSGQFNVSLTLSAAKLETQQTAGQQPTSNKSSTSTTKSTTTTTTTSITTSSSTSLSSSTTTNVPSTTSTTSTSSSPTTTTTTLEHSSTTNSTTKLETTSTTLTTHTTEEESADTQPILFLIALVVVVAAFALIIMRKKKNAKHPET